jgi:RNA polymerase sigma-70 factor (ECF subfamily)
MYDGSGGIAIGNPGLAAMSMLAVIAHNSIPAHRKLCYAGQRANNRKVRINDAAAMQKTGAGFQLREQTPGSARCLEENSMKDDFQQQLVALLPQLRRFALSICGDVHEADDLVQAACEKALIKHEQWQAGTKLHSWLYRIVQNLHIDKLRKEKTRHLKLVASVEAEENLYTDSDEIEVNDMAERTSQLINELPAEQRSVLLLVAVEGYSYNEAAEILDIPKGTVMSRLSRARSQIQAKMDHKAITADNRSPQ